MIDFLLKFRSEKGSSLVIFALSLSALAGSLALVTDAGLLYYNKVKLTNAVDAAALAGAQALPARPNQARSIAYSLAASNGVPAGSLDVDITTGHQGIRVRATREVPHTLARLLGFNSTVIDSSCEAQVANLSAVTGIAPLSIEDQELHFGEDYVLKYGAGSSPGGSYHSGWFGALRLGGNGASVYKNNLINGYQHEVAIGDILEIEDGNMSGSTSAGIAERINQCTHSPACTFDSYKKGCPRVVIVPVIRPFDSKSVQVAGFAAFFIEYVAGQGNENYVWGKFIKMQMPGDLTSNPDADFGVHGIRLIR